MTTHSATLVTASGLKSFKGYPHGELASEGTGAEYGA